MRNLRQSLRALFVTIVMLCVSMTVFAETVDIDGKYYDLMNGMMPIIIGTHHTIRMQHLLQVLQEVEEIIVVTFK